MREYQEYKLEQEEKEQIKDFLRNLKLYDKNDITIGLWDISTWHLGTRDGHYMFIQLDNNMTGKQFRAIDIETEEELEYKVEKIINRLNNYDYSMEVIR